MEKNKNRWIVVAIVAAVVAALTTVLVLVLHFVYGRPVWRKLMAWLAAAVGKFGFLYLVVVL